MTYESSDKILFSADGFGKFGALDAREEWDELEKSVVSHIADNIEVSIRNNDVDLVIVKRIGARA